MHLTKNIIHVGLPKTATTLIQKEILPLAYEKALITKPFTINSKLFNSIMYSDDLLYDSGEVKSKFDSKHKLVISDEMLFGSPWVGFTNRTRTCRRLAEVFPDARIVISIRNQRSWIKSFYRQLVKVGLWNDFMNERFIYSYRNEKLGRKGGNQPDRFIDHHRLIPAIYLNFFDAIEVYKRHFEDVRIVVFEDLKHDKDSWIDSVSDAFAIKPGLVRKGAKMKVNTPVSDQELYRRLIWRRLNRLIGKNKSNRYISKFISLITPKDIISERHVEKTYQNQNYAHSNKKVNEKYNVNLNKYSHLYFE